MALASFLGFKPQSSIDLGFGRGATTNVSVVGYGYGYGAVHKTTQFRSSKKPSRARFHMMSVGVPRVPLRSPGEGAWSWVDLPNALYRERVIYVGEEIDEEFSNQILATMLYLDSVDQRKMFLYINSGGGDITPCMALFDTIRSLQSPVGTACVGYAYDLAGFMLAAGVKGSRAAFPMARVKLQAPAGAARGQADDVLNEVNELLRLRDYLFKELAEMTGHPVEKIHKDIGKMGRKSFSAQEALEYGIIDQIIRPGRVKRVSVPTREEPQSNELGAGFST